MGTWGTSIGSSDTHADIYGAFFELYNNGKDVSEITEILISNNEGLLESPEYGNDFWFAIAKAQWECKQLQPAIHEKVRVIVESGSDLKVWEDLDASKGDLEKRRKVLDKFLTRLQSDRPKAKRRKKRIIRQPLFAKGDCLAFRLETGNYGGAIILEAQHDTEFGSNLVGVTRINLNTLPTPEDFEKAEVLLKNFQSWRDEPAIYWKMRIRVSGLSLINIVGSLSVNKNYLVETEKYKYSWSGGDWGRLSNDVDCQLNSELAKPRTVKKLLVKTLTKGSS